MARCWGWLALVLLTILIPWEARADGKISTYLEGTLLRKSASEWVLATDEGTYWISLERPPSWRRNRPNGEISFWIQLKQIRKFRPRHVREPQLDADAETAVAGL